MKQQSADIIKFVSIGIALLLSAIAIGVAVGSLHEGLKIKHNVESADQLESHLNQSINAKVISLLKPIEDKFSNITNSVHLLYSIQSSRDQLSNLTNLVHVLYSMQLIRDLIRTCSAGVKDGRVSDLAMTASSFYNANHSPSRGRLDYSGSKTAASGWASLLSIGFISEWLQVDFTSPTMITGVVTQGRGDLSFQQWVTSFKISYSNSTTSFQTIPYSNGTDIIFQGNRDPFAYVMNKFPQPITARYFRLYPQTWNNHISLRLDYLTC